MSIDIRPIQPDEIAASDRVLRAAFDRSYSFAPLVRLHLAAEPAGFFVADEAGQVVGTACLIDYGRLAYIGLMSVHPGWQSHGLGRRLLGHVLDILDRRACPVALLDATDKGALLYETMGFVDDSTAYVYELHAPVRATPMAAAVAPATVTDLAEIAALDAPWFGADRSKLLTVLWNENWRRCLLARDSSGKLTGYLLARDPVLGPWAASSPDTAEALLQAVLALPFQARPLVMVPRSNGLSIALLERYGFHQTRHLRHMRRGGSGPPGQPQHLYGQASFGHG